MIVLPASAKTDRSMPAVKCLPVLETTITRAAALSEIALIAAGNSTQKALFIALRFSGRLRTTCAIWSVIETVMVSKSGRAGRDDVPAAG